MSSRRIFHVDDITLHPEVPKYLDAVDATLELRKEFLASWGSSRIMIDTRSQAVVALKIPDDKTYEEVKALGWVRHSSQWPSYVRPGAKPIARPLSDALRALDYPDVMPALEPVLAHLKSVCPNMRDVHPHRWWYSTGGSTYIGHVTLVRVVGMPFLHLPDPTLPYETIPGMTEVFERHYDRVVDVHDGMIELRSKGYECAYSRDDRIVYVAGVGLTESGFLDQAEALEKTGSFTDPILARLEVKSTR